MTNRRVWLSAQKMHGRALADFEGMAGETGEGELFQPYGLSSAKTGESVLISVNSDANNFVILPARGDVLAQDETIVYWQDTKISLTDDAVKISVGGNFFTLSGGEIRTDMNITTSGSIVADGDVTGAGVSLSSHTHGGVQSGGSVTGGPQ